MEGERGPGRLVPGCAVGLATLVAGVALGVALTLGWLGLGPGALLSGQAGAAATATPVRPTALQGQAAPGRRIIWSAPIPLDSDTRDPDLLVISHNYDREQGSDTIAYLSPDAGAVRWESPPLGERGNSWVVAYDDTMVMVAVETRLIGLRRASGEVAWEAPLTDAIARYLCHDCLQIVGATAVALPQDGILQAFDVATGAPRWSVRLRETTRQLVRVGALIGVPDSVPGSPGQGALYLYDPADGSPAGEILPSCRAQNGYEQRVSYYADIGVDPAGRMLSWVVSSSPACLVTYDIATGALSRTWLDELGSGAGDRRNSLWAGDTLYLGDGDLIYAVGPQERRLLLEAEGYDIRAVAANETALLVVAKRTRGSSRYELWALDRASGERRWGRVLVADDPAEYPGDYSDFVVGLVGNTVVLVEQHEEPEQIIYELIGLTDGASRARAALAVKDPDSVIRGATWGRDHVFLSIDELYGVELSSGRTAYAWP